MSELVEKTSLVLQVLPKSSYTRCEKFKQSLIIYEIFLPLCIGIVSVE